MRERDQFLVQFCWRFQCNCSVLPVVRNDWVDPHIPLVEVSESNKSGSANIKKIVHLFSGNSTSITTNEFPCLQTLDIWVHFFTSSKPMLLHKCRSVAETFNVHLDTTLVPHISKYFWITSASHEAPIPSH